MVNGAVELVRITSAPPLDQRRPPSDPTLSLLCVCGGGGVVSLGRATSMSSVRLVGGRAPAQHLPQHGRCSACSCLGMNPGHRTPSFQAPLPVDLQDASMLHHLPRRCRAEDPHVGLPCSFNPLSPRSCVSHPSHPIPLFALEDVRLMACQAASPR